MAVGDETIGEGTTIAVNDGVADAFVDIAKVIDITPPSEVTGSVESKRLDTPVVAKVPGYRTPGQLTIKQQHTKAGWARLEALRAARSVKQWRLTVPDDDGETERTFTGFITENKATTIVGDQIKEFETMVEISDEET